MLEQLREQLQNLSNQMRAIYTNATDAAGNQRALTTEELTSFNTLREQRDGVQAQIDSYSTYMQMRLNQPQPQPQPAPVQTSGVNNPASVATPQVQTQQRTQQPGATQVQVQPPVQPSTQTVIPVQVPAQRAQSTIISAMGTQQPGAGPAIIRQLGDDQHSKVVDFSFLRAIDLAANRGSFDGLEAEMIQEGRNEARTMGLQSHGHIVLPSFFFSDQRHRNFETRDLDVSTPTQGQETVPTFLRPLIAALRPTLVTESMGASVLRGLTGNIAFPRNTNVGNATWKTEKATADEAQQNFDQLLMQPKRLTAWSEYSRQLMVQSSIDVERFVRADLMMAVGTEVDRTVYNGSGAAPEPEGLYPRAGIPTVDMGGAAPTHPLIVAMETKVENANALESQMGYITTPNVKGQLKTTPIDAGSGRMMWGVNPGSPFGTLNGYRAASTQQMPKDLGVGNDEHGLIFGNWAACMIGQWGPVDLIVNPFTKAKQAMIEVIVNSFWDINYRWDAHFVKAEGVIPSGLFA